MQDTSSPYVTSTNLMYKVELPRPNAPYNVQRPYVKEIAPILKLFGGNRILQAMIYGHGSYHPLRVSVAVMLIVALLTPVATYACEMTGLITRALPMSINMSHPDATHTGAHDDHASDHATHCDREATTCGLSAECESNAMESEPCFVSYPGLEDGLVASSEKLTLVAVSDALDSRPAEPVLTRTSSPASERDRPSERHRPVALHLSHSSFLL